MKMKLPLPKIPIKKHKRQINVKELNQLLRQFSQKFRISLDKNDFQNAYQYILKANQLAPNHPKILMDLAYTELKLAKFAEAYKHYEQAIQYSSLDIDTNIYDGLTESCYFLNLSDKLIHYGRLAISSKKELVKHLKVYTLPDAKPPAFDSKKASENIISYSLFGNSPRYCEISIMNVDLAKEIYPEWTCRFYIDETVPQEIQNRLYEKGAQIVKVTREQAKLSGLVWRFFVLDDPQVNCFLIRDADSLLSYREKSAVDAWLKSGKWFHGMRDFYTHTELILAGMWGGFNGVFIGVENQIRNYIESGQYLSDKVLDQHYLRQHIWPTLNQSALYHDSQGFDESAESFPDYSQKKKFENFPNFHVGMNEGSAQISVQIDMLDAKYVDWTLVDLQTKTQICCYTSLVLDSRKVLLDLPQQYVMHLNSGDWELRIYLAENTD